MTSVSRAQFSVLIKGNMLVATQILDGAKRTLCALDLRQQPSFYLSLGHVLCRDAQGREFTIDTGSIVEADDLLAQLVAAKLRRHDKISLRYAVFLGALLSLSGAAGIWWDQMSATATLDRGIRTVSSAPLPSSRADSLPRPSTSAGRELPPARAIPDLVASSPAPAAIVAADNGWTLPASIQAALPEKLLKAAERKLFTVDFSSGHARTLFVFADPGCPNCQRLEPLLQAAAKEFNVVVFPVAVIGKGQSIAAITPVLCLPPEQRKAAWAALFDPGHDGLSLGQKPASDDVGVHAGGESGECDVAKKALGINEVAYQAYRIPGTPWVIADDGRYVSQALLRDPAKLEAFLNRKEAADASE